jgi:hypothetical protein
MTQVISDFDYTLSNYWVTDDAGNRVKNDSSHGFLEHCKQLSSDCERDMSKLTSHYYKIEIDPLLSREDKLPHMISWWTGAHNL